MTTLHPCGCEGDAPDVSYTFSALQPVDGIARFEKTGELPSAWTITQQFQTAVYSVGFGATAGDYSVARETQVAESPVISKTEFFIGGFWAYQVLLTWNGRNWSGGQQQNVDFAYLIVRLFEGSTQFYREDYLLRPGGTTKRARTVALVAGEPVFTAEGDREELPNVFGPEPSGGFGQPTGNLIRITGRESFKVRLETWFSNYAIPFVSFTMTKQAGFC